MRILQKKTFYSAKKQYSVNRKRNGHMKKDFGNASVLSRL